MICLIMALKIIGPNKDVASWAVLNFISARIVRDSGSKMQRYVCQLLVMGRGCICVKYECNTLFDYLIGILSSEI